MLHASVQLPIGTVDYTYYINNIKKPISRTLQLFTLQLQSMLVMYSITTDAVTYQRHDGLADVTSAFPSLIEVLFIEDCHGNTYISILNSNADDIIITKLMDRPFDGDMIYEWTDQYVQNVVASAFLHGIIT